MYEVFEISRTDFYTCVIKTESSTIATVSCLMVIAFIHLEPFVQKRVKLTSG